eukprot:g4501.t1
MGNGTGVLSASAVETIDAEIQRPLNASDLGSPVEDPYSAVLEVSRLRKVLLQHLHHRNPAAFVGLKDENFPVSERDSLQERDPFHDKLREVKLNLQRARVTMPGVTPILVDEDWGLQQQQQQQEDKNGKQQHVNECAYEMIILRGLAIPSSQIVEAGKSVDVICHVLNQPPADEAAILLSQDGKLPSIQLPSDFRRALPIVREKLHSSWELDATVLRFSTKNGRRILELELHDVTWLPEKAGCNEWCEMHEALGRVDAHDGTREMLVQLIDEIEGRASLGRAPWEKRGWFGIFAGWVEHQLLLQGMVQDDPLRQLKLSKHAFVASCPTVRHGTVFASARSDMHSGRSAVHVATLFHEVKQWRRSVPFVVGFNMERRWLLTQDVSRRLTMRHADDDEDPGNPIYKKLYKELSLTDIGSRRVFLTWKKFFDNFADLQIDSDFRMTRLQKFGLPMSGSNWGGAQPS